MCTVAQTEHTRARAHTHTHREKSIELLLQDKPKATREPQSQAQRFVETLMKQVLFFAAFSVVDAAQSADKGGGVAWAAARSVARGHRAEERRDGGSPASSASRLASPFRIVRHLPPVDALALRPAGMRGGTRGFRLGERRAPLTVKPAKKRGGWVFGRGPLTPAGSARAEECQMRLRARCE